MIINSFGKISYNEILEKIEENNIVIPKEYVEFLLKTNGGRIYSQKEKVVIEIADLHQKVYLNRFLGFCENEQNDIIYYNNKYRDDIGDGSLIIGIDDQNNYIVIVNYNHSLKVCYWDINLKVPISTEQGNAYIISESISDFMQKLGEIDIVEDKENDNAISVVKEGEKDMERIEYHALGSVVLLEGGIQKLVITSRGLVVKNGENEYFFDYAGVLYPDGLISDQIVYFNHADIAKVVFEGYTDEDDRIVVDNINKYLEKHPDIEEEAHPRGKNRYNIVDFISDACCIWGGVCANIENATYNIIL